MAEATIDELQIEISSDSDSAAQSIDDFAQSLSRLIAPVQALTGSGSGLAKLSKQIEKLSENYAFSIQNKVRGGTVTRFCTSWASTEANVDKLIKDIEGL